MGEHRVVCDSCSIVSGWASGVGEVRLGGVGLLVVSVDVVDIVIVGGDAEVIDKTGVVDEVVVDE